MSILTVFSMNISAIVLAIAGVFGIGEGGGGASTSGSPPPKDEGALKKCSGKVEGVIKKSC